MRAIHREFSFSIEDLDRRLKDDLINLTPQELEDIWEYFFGWIEANQEDSNLTFDMLDNDTYNAYREAIAYLGKKGKIPKESAEYDEGYFEDADELGVVESES